MWLFFGICFDVFLFFDVLCFGFFIIGVLVFFWFFIEFVNGVIRGVVIVELVGNGDVFDLVVGV